ncbi:hypothetical protein C1J03_01870 [Sulfitobacter sp. SK012]|nr:hypothetical protein C1J03_01870 [Sulfitobacter sp. SK012]
MALAPVVIDPILLHARCKRIKARAALTLRCSAPMLVKNTRMEQFHAHDRNPHKPFVVGGLRRADNPTDLGNYWHIVLI